MPRIGWDAGRLAMTDECGWTGMLEGVHHGVHGEHGEGGGARRSTSCVSGSRRGYAVDCVDGESFQPRIHTDLHGWCHV